MIEGATMFPKGALASSSISRIKFSLVAIQVQQLDLIVIKGNIYKVLALQFMERERLASLMNNTSQLFTRSSRAQPLSSNGKA